MATEWIDVIDSAVKIGLGALITGLTGYQVSKLNNQKEHKKIFGNKKVEIIEQICDFAEEYFYYFSSINNYVGGVLLNASNIGQNLTERQTEIFVNIQDGIKDVLKKRNKALSKIRILSIKGAEDELLAFNECLAEYRDIINNKKILITHENRERIYNTAIMHKNKFYDCISAYFNSIYK